MNNIKKTIDELWKVSENLRRQGGVQVSSESLCATINDAIEILRAADNLLATTGWHKKEIANKVLSKDAVGEL